MMEYFQVDVLRDILPVFLIGDKPEHDLRHQPLGRQDNAVEGLPVAAQYQLDELPVRCLVPCWMVHGKIRPDGRSNVAINPDKRGISFTGIKKEPLACWRQGVRSAGRQG